MARKVKNKSRQFADLFLAHLGLMDEGLVTWADAAREAGRYKYAPTAQELAKRKKPISKQLRIHFRRIAVPVTAYLVKVHKGVIPQDPIEVNKCVASMHASMTLNRDNRTKGMGTNVGFYISPKANALFKRHQQIRAESNDGLMVNQEIELIGALGVDAVVKQRSERAAQRTQRVNQAMRQEPKLYDAKVVQLEHKKRKTG